MPYTTVVAGTAITASWSNANNRDQTIVPFTNSTTRDAAITAPVEGMLCYLSDSKTFWGYTGAAWTLTGKPIRLSRRTSDSAGVTSSTALVDDPVLLVPVVANRVYRMRSRIVYTAAGGAAAGQLKVGWSGPASATMDWSVLGLVVNGASGVSGSFTCDQGAIGDARSIGAGGASLCTMWMDGIATIAGTAGNLQFRYAQVVSSGTATIIKAHSIVELEMIV